jgi:hypothetical protein
MYRSASGKSPVALLASYDSPAVEIDLACEVEPASLVAKLGAVCSPELFGPGRAEVPVHEIRGWWHVRVSGPPAPPGMHLVQAVMGRPLLGPHGGSAASAQRGSGVPIGGAPVPVDLADEIGHLGVPEAASRRARQDQAWCPARDTSRAGQSRMTTLSWENSFSAPQLIDSVARTVSLEVETEGREAASARAARSQ